MYEKLRPYNLKISMNSYGNFFNVNTQTEPLKFKD